eukprot:ctg_2515.g502
MRKAPPPLERRERLKLWSRIHSLESLMREAVRNEQYMEAARWRDEARAVRRQDRFVYLSQALQEALAANRAEESAALREALRKESPPPHPEEFLFPLLDDEEASEVATENAAPREASEASLSTGSGAAGEKRKRGRPKASSTPAADSKKAKSRSAAGKSEDTLRDARGIPAVTAYNGVSNGVRVAIKTYHLPDESIPDRGQYMFGYQVEIYNETGRTMQLVSRYWRIENRDSGVSEVRGPGVVGKQPILAPSQSFSYSSMWQVRLGEPGDERIRVLATMQGRYRFVTGAVGELMFDVQVGPFHFVLPEA